MATRTTDDKIGLVKPFRDVPEPFTALEARDDGLLEAGGTYDGVE